MSLLDTARRRALRLIVPTLPDGAARALYNRTSGPVRGDVGARLRPYSLKIDHLRFRLHPADNLSERAMWVNRRLHEPRSVEQLVAVVRDPKTLVFDIGANAGTFTVPLAKALGAGGRVVAIEPNPVMVARLRHNLALNGLEDRVDVETIALSDAAGTTDLHVYAHNMGEASLRPDQRHAGRTINVEVRTLAQLIAARPGFDRIVVKMDVEGVEDRVLRGVLEMDQDCPVDHLLMETQHAKDWSDPLLDRLAERGFRTIFSGEGNTFFSRG